MIEVIIKMIIFFYKFKMNIILLFLSLKIIIYLYLNCVFFCVGWGGGGKRLII